MRQRNSLPAPSEIKAQLQRMRDSARFMAAASQLRFLTLVVSRAMKGEKSPEEVIGPILFPGFIKDESLDVRATASNLRKTLRRYYCGEGAEGLVLIALPEPPGDRSIKLPRGEAYTPVFSYNSNHAATRELKLGEYYLARGLHEDLGQAVTHFLAAHRLAPDSFMPLIGIAEALVDVSAVDLGACEQDRVAWHRIAESLVGQAGQREPGFWRLHAARGSLLTSRDDLMSAAAEFELALSMDRHSTENHSGYFTYLLKAGRGAEALELMRRRLDSHVDDVRARAQYALALYNAGRAEDAEHVLKEALRMDKSNFAVHFALAFLYARMDRGREAMDHVEYVRALVDEASYEQLKWRVNNSWWVQPKSN